MKHSSKAVFVLFLVFVTTAWSSNIQAREQKQESAFQKGNQDVWSDPRFPVGPTLAPAIDFWKQIFTEYSYSSMIFHDHTHHGLIWDEIELPLKNNQVDDRRAQRVVNQHQRKLEKRLKTLASLDLQSELLPEDSTLSNVIDSAKAGPYLTSAYRRVRAQRGMAEEFERAIERAKPNLQRVIRILEEEGVPAELVAIPFVESMFNPKAYSYRGAAGLWQLMPRTARELKLKVNRQIDERRSIEHSTRAAARILKNNYRLLKSWPLAITAYNHGPYGIRRAVQKVGSNKLPDLIKNYKKGTWGFSSKNFYAEVIAIIQILKEKSLLP